MPEEYSCLIEKCNEIKGRLESIDCKTIELREKTNSYGKLVDDSGLSKLENRTDHLERELQEVINGIIILQSLMGIKGNIVK